jgi:hypothetical protein
MLGHAETMPGLACTILSIFSKLPSVLAPRRSCGCARYAWAMPKDAGAMPGHTIVVLDPAGTALLTSCKVELPVCFSSSAMLCYADALPCRGESISEHIGVMPRHVGIMLGNVGALLGPCSCHAEPYSGHFGFMRRPCQCHTGARLMPHWVILRHAGASLRHAGARPGYAGAMLRPCWQHAGPCSCHVSDILKNHVNIIS